MAQKLKNIKKRTIKKVTLDPLYKSFWYSKFLNKLMLDGKKHAIEKIVAEAFLKFKWKYNVTPTTMLVVILHKLRPVVAFIPKRLAGNWRRVPVPLKTRSQLGLALKWLISNIKLETEFNLHNRVIATFSKIFRRKTKNKRAKPNELLKKKKEHYFEAITNRINTRFRWK